ncbi:MAG: hypothetical protein QOJ52_3679, partial [Acidimicrobiaceae bacterium]|nr:hypothetical protein [Acidimicrobiaceae bacterium]
SRLPKHTLLQAAPILLIDADGRNQLLHGDLTLEQEVLGTPHHTGSAPADRLHQLVPVRDLVFQLLRPHSLPIPASALR